jgi:gamma-glutamyltranspeptidase/glutathione hydrolase
VSGRVRRCLRRTGIVVASILAGLGGLAWYLSGLPWRNHCADAPVVRPSLGRPANSAVATSHPLATKAAADALTAGGSAADAAIAAALVLSVAEPGNSGLGGGGFALVHDPTTDRDLALDFRERAPLGLNVAELRAAVKDNPHALRAGALAVAVPAEWKGLLELHRRFGRLPLSALARPAIAAARSGVKVGRDYFARCWVRFASLRRSPEARRIFMTSRGGLCPLPGWVLRQPDLADTLAALTDGAHPIGWDELVGKKMVAFLASAGSRMSPSDLAAAQAVERPVVTGHFRGRRIVSIGPPSSGGILVIELLQTYERMRERLPRANRIHLWTEASRLAFYDRAKLLGDPDFVPVPVDRLVSAGYAEGQAARVSERDALLLPDDTGHDGGTHTTHVSVIDKSGMAVALTQTINTPFGSGLVVPGTGVLLNNEMDDFYVDGPNAFGLVGNDRNGPAPGKRPLSSMSPTFVFAGKELVMALGSPGGSSIPSAVAWVIREALEDQRSGEEAVRAPRVHDQWSPDVVEVEPRLDRGALPPDLGSRTKTPRFPIGRVQMVAREPDGWHGVSDCRDEGEPWWGAL